MTPPEAAPAAATPSTGQVRRPLLALALGLLLAVVLLELAAGSALKAPRQAHHEATVLAIPGVATMIRGAGVDPTELAQVAARQHPPTPLALPTAALLDGLLLVGATMLALPQLLSGRGAIGGARLGSFLASLAILLGGIAVVVAAISRLRYLVALYLSPPLGTLSYLLLYGSFRRGNALLVLSVVLALKVGAGIAYVRAFPRASARRGLVGVAMTSIAATVATAFCYALASSSRASIADALAATLVALAAIFWAGVIVSGSVRRLT